MPKLYAMVTFTEGSNIEGAVNALRQAGFEVVELPLDPMAPGSLRATGHSRPRWSARLTMRCSTWLTRFKTDDLYAAAFSHWRKFWLGLYTVETGTA